MEENIQTTYSVSSDYKPKRHSAKTTMAFGFGAMTDQMSHQMFQFLIFTYYFAVVDVGVITLGVSFIVFAIWDSINDPLLGPLSDRTKSKFGRRRFWIIISFVPFALINIFLFTPPKFWGIGPTSEIVNGIYMIVIIMLYDLIYTVFSINQLSLFPEMFKNEKARGRANKYKNLLTILGLLIGFVVPTLLINPMVPNVDTLEARAEVSKMYVQTGLMIAAFVLVFSFIFFRYGMKEDKNEIQEEIKKEETPGIFESLKATLKNKTFLIFVTANLFVWTTFKTLYGIHIIGIEEGNMLLTVLLLAALLTAAALFPVMEWLGNKIGFRNGFMVTEGIWIAALIPFLFLDNHPIAAVICMCFVGIGLSGAMYFVDIIIGRVIDEDELNTGLRRQGSYYGVNALIGSYYGVNALINRYSTIVVFLAITIVLTGYGFENYLVGEGVDYTGLKTGLKVLMVGVNIGSLIIVLILLKT